MAKTEMTKVGNFYYFVQNCVSYFINIFVYLLQIKALNYVRKNMINVESMSALAFKLWLKSMAILFIFTSVAEYW